MISVRAKAVYTPREVLKDAWVSWDETEGVIMDVGTGPVPPSSQVIDEPDGVVCPGFIDIHVHGGSGNDPTGTALSLRERHISREWDDLRPLPDVVESILKLSQYKASTGVTAFLPTTGAVPDEVNISVTIAALEAQRVGQETWENGGTTGSQILGVNLEGPFVSPAKKGAQPLDFIKKPSLEEARKLVETVGGVVKMMTLAPELPGSVEVIKYLVTQGILVSLGHSDASYIEAKKGIDAGISHATHVFSGMRGFHHREPGALGAVLMDDRVTAELIMDGIHVDPVASKLLLKLKGLEKVCLITDAISAAGLEDGDYSLYGSRVRVVRGKAVLVDSADGVLAGSTLSMATAVKNAVNMMGVSLSEALVMASENPARIVGVFDKKGSIAPGKDADLVLIDSDFTVLRTFVRGREVYSKVKRA